MDYGIKTGQKQMRKVLYKISQGSNFILFLCSLIFFWTTFYCQEIKSTQSFIVFWLPCRDHIFASGFDQDLKLGGAKPNEKSWEFFF